VSIGITDVLDDDSVDSVESLDVEVVPSVGATTDGAHAAMHASNGKNDHDLRTPATPGIVAPVRRRRGS
jgi:hypothetical protein